jgi:hypothetical protein
MRHWIGGRDVHLEAIEPEQYQGYRIDTVVGVWPNPVHSCDVSVAVRLQIVVPVWVCQLNLSRLDGHRRPAQHDTFDFDQCP